MADLFPELFDKFWEAYPRKVGKKAAVKAFAKFDEAKQRAAIADVEKRTRMRAWSGNKKLIPHAATFLNGERWEDDWQAELKVERDDLPNTGPVAMPEPKVPEREFTLPEVRINKAFRDWLFCAGGVDDVKPALREKADVMENCVPAFREDIDAGVMTRERASFEIVDLFLNRLDHAYGRSLRESVWAHMRKAA